MMKLRVGVLFGGTFSEHEVSCAAGLAVFNALHANDRFEPIAIGITKAGRTVLPSDAQVRVALDAVATRPTAIADRFVAEGEAVRLVTGNAPSTADIVAAGPPANILGTLDIVFPVLMGPLGEDGAVQGHLEMLGVPYTGSGVLGSAVASDKLTMKRVLIAAGLPVLPYVGCSEARWRLHSDPDTLFDDLDPPYFVKPANFGSSVGISRANDAEDLPLAIEAALKYDHSFLVESGVNAREIECGVLGGAAPGASVPGEIIVANGFYDYESKYLRETAELVVPAELRSDVVEAIRSLALETFEAVGAWGLARVDFFVDDDGVYVNEINTMPGFTPSSMFARCWEATGLRYVDQIDRLIKVGFERHGLVSRRTRAHESLKGT